MNKLQRRALTAALALAGALAFRFVGLPLPFLFGPMAVCLLGALAGVQLQGFGVVATLARTILGVAIGGSITPEIVSELPRMSATLVLMPVYVAVIALIGVPYFHRVMGYDLPTAWYASMPGGLQDMILFGQDAGADTRALSLVHATRVLVIVSVAPFVIVHGFGVPLTDFVGEPALSLPAGELLLMAAAALGGWKLAERVGLFGASILGPMIATAGLSLAGLIHGRPPAEAILAAQFILGVGVGVGYVGVTLAELRRVILAGVIFVGILAVLAVAVTEMVIHLGLAPGLEAFLAFAPGGQGELTVLGLAAGADLGFIVVHHVFRMVTVIVCAPIAIGIIRRWLARR